MASRLVRLQMSADTKGEFQSDIHVEGRLFPRSTKDDSGNGGIRGEDAERNVRDRVLRALWTQGMSGMKGTA